MSVIEVDDDSFQTEVFGTAGWVLAEFSRPGVNEYGEPDKSTRTGAILDEIASEYDGRVKMLRVPMDRCEATADHFGVTTVPTVLFFKDGSEVERTTDFHLKAWFKTRLNELLAK